MSGKYDSLLRRGRHFSEKHPPMPNCERAAQFAPFAALIGAEEAVDETERQVELDDGGIEELDRALRLIAEQAGERPEISVTWFRPDDRKDGGAYLTWRGRLKKMDMYERKLVFADGRSIPIDSIRSVECGLNEKTSPATAE